MSDQRPARKVTCEDMEMHEEAALIHADLMDLCLALGAWGESRHKSNLDTIAAAANLIAIAARRIEEIAEAETGERETDEDPRRWLTDDQGHVIDGDPDEDTRKWRKEDV